MKKIIYYLPRVLSILIILFFALFIAEAFDPSFGWQSGLMHGLLALVVLAISIIGWKWPKVGCWIFFAIGLFLLPFLPAVVPLIIGVLYLLEGYKGNKKLIILSLIIIAIMAVVVGGFKAFSLY